MAETGLSRFVGAQAPIIARALAELRAGRKQSHWMWFVFPQLVGLGHSATSDHFALHSLEEAAAYFAHPLLGPRLKECCQAVTALEGLSARDIFGAPDDLKFRSSLTLFAKAVPEERIFHALLEKYFDGAPDPATLDLLAR